MNWSGEHLERIRILELKRKEDTLLYEGPIKSVDYNGRHRYEPFMADWKIRIYKHRSHRYHTGQPHRMPHQYKKPALRISFTRPLWAESLRLLLLGEKPS